MPNQFLNHSAWPACHTYFYKNTGILLSSVPTLVTNRCTISVLWGTLMSVTTNQLTSTQLYCYDKKVNLKKKYFIDLKTHHTFIPQLSKVRTTKKNDTLYKHDIPIYF